MTIEYGKAVKGWFECGIGSFRLGVDFCTWSFGIDLAFRDGFFGINLGPFYMGSYPEAK